MRKNRKKILLGVGGVLLSGLLLNQHILTVQAESVKPFKAKQQVQAKFTTNGTYNIDSSSTESLTKKPSTGTILVEVSSKSVNNPQSHRILTNTEDDTTDLLKTSSSEQNHSISELISEVDKKRTEIVTEQKKEQPKEEVKQVHPMGSVSAPISSGFGEVRSMMLTNGSFYQDVHNGVDFVGPDGTPIYSYRDGVVISSEIGPDGGEGIVIQHDNGLYSYSWHLQSGSRTVQAGETVKAGQMIGRQGSTGMVTGSHLHFGLSTGYWDGYVNPLDHL